MVTGRLISHVSGGTYGLLLMAGGASSHADLMERVTNGFGAKIDIKYPPLTDASIYTKARMMPITHWQMCNLLCGL